VLEETTGYAGFFRIARLRLRHRLFGGGWSPALRRELFERGHAVAVLPYDPVRDLVVLIEQFRAGALRDPRGAWLLEPVAGMIEPGESGLEVARREMREECGLELLDLVPVAEYLASPGGSSERTSLYVGRVDAWGAGGIHGLGEEGEDIRVHALAFTEAMRLLDSGRARAGTLLIALLWLARARDDLRRSWAPGAGLDGRAGEG
jgi:ADP-ribose pyrophosphatase